MNKKFFFFTLCLIPIFFFTACGITEELEQAKLTVADLKVALSNQQTNYEQLEERVASVTADFESDLHEDPKGTLFMNGEGAVYDNVQARLEIAKEMATIQKQIKKNKKELTRIVKKNGADVNNRQVKLISQSLDIVSSNFDSLSVYVETSRNQENEFFADFPTENLNEQLAIVQRTYGAIHIVSEEAGANIDYTLSLINTFEKEAAKNKNRGGD